MTSMKRRSASELRGTAYHEAGHAVVGVFETDRLRRDLIALAEEEVRMLEGSAQSGADNLPPAWLKVLRGAKRDLSAARRGRCLRAVTIRPKKGDFLGCTYRIALISDVAIEYAYKEARRLMRAMVAGCLSGELAEVEFTGSASLHGADYDKESALRILEPLTGAHTTEADWIRLWAASRRRARRLLRRPEVRRAIQLFTQVLLREERIPGRRAEELIRRELYHGGPAE